MQVADQNKITCRCCGHRFHYVSRCPLCGYKVVASLPGAGAQLDEEAKKEREAHPENIITKVGVVCFGPAVWSGDDLKMETVSYLELASIVDLKAELCWNSSSEFASFGMGEEAELRVYFEYLDGSRTEKTTAIRLPLVRGETWKAAVRMAEQDDGVVFAVGVPGRFTETGIVKFCD